MTHRLRPIQARGSFEHGDGKWSFFPKSGLMLIGMGPGKISSMTIEAKQAAIAADYRHYEAYTALWPEESL